MSLDAKIAAAVELIVAATGHHARPIVASSFGKDSMVLLSLVARAGFKLPILFFREPFFPRKYSFANWIILQHDYVVYDYPPRQTLVSKRNGEMEIVNLHDAPGRPLYLPTGIRPPVDGDEAYLCGLLDLYDKPKGSFPSFPWDLILIGHKNSDTDPILGPCPLNTDLQPGEAGGAPALCFPLRHFTDEDVWTYTERFKLPINHRRYDRTAGWKEFADITYNPDYFHACTACIDRDNPAMVMCPRLGREIPNISSQVLHLDAIKLPAYVGKE